MSWVDGVKCCTQVEENEDVDLVLVDGAQQVVGDSDEHSLSTVVGTVMFNKIYLIK